MTDPLLPVRGSPGSPYTRKMLALLRYRRIPYRYMQSNTPSLPEPKVALIPVFYFDDGAGGLEATVDSTPIIRRLETEYPGRSVIPGDPVLALIDALLEDYGDEWLTKAMFHYRWYYQADIDMAGSVLPHYADVTQDDDTLLAMKKAFSERQISRLYVVGSNDTTAPVIEESYERFLGCLNTQLKEAPFLLGQRPGAADFACFGQLTQLVQFDPTPSALAIAHFPRVHAWVSKMEDLSGLEPAADDFMDLNNPPADLLTSLKAMLHEIGHTYIPVLLANGAALENSEAMVETEVHGKRWQQEPFPYQGKCLQSLRIAYARLSEEDQARTLNLLAGTGCDALFAPAEARTS